MNTIMMSAPVPSKTVFLRRRFSRTLPGSEFLLVLVPFLAALSPGVWNRCDARASAAEAARADFFVSPEGDDRWSGALPEPNPQRTDGPLATAERARDAVRKLRAASNSIGPCGSSSAEVPTAARSRWCCAGRMRARTAARRSMSPTPMRRPSSAAGLSSPAGKRDKGPLWKVELPEVKSGRWYFRQSLRQRPTATPAKTAQGRRVRPGGPAEDGYQRLDGCWPGGQESVGPEGVSVQAG